MKTWFEIGGITKKDCEEREYKRVAKEREEAEKKKIEELKRRVIKTTEKMAEEVRRLAIEMIEKQKREEQKDRRKQRKEEKKRRSGTETKKEIGMEIRGSWQMIEGIETKDIYEAGGEEVREDQG